MNKLIELLEKAMRIKAQKEVKGGLERDAEVFLNVHGIKGASGDFSTWAAREDFETLSNKYIDAAIAFRTEQLIQEFIRNSENLNEMFASLHQSRRAVVNPS